MTDRPLHICFVSLRARAALIPAQGGRIGGAETQVARLAHWLAEREGMRVAVIVGDEGQPLRERAGAVELLKIAQPALPGVRAAVSSASLYQTARAAGADVYVQRTAGVETGIVHAAAASIRRPFIFMASSDMECAPPWTGAGPRGRLFRHGLRGAARILVQHAAQAERYRSVHGVQPDIFHSVYEFPPEPPGERPARALWVGRCVEVKGPSRFLDLARSLAPRPCVMVAPPSPSEPQLFQNISHAAESLPNLTFHAGLPPAAVEALYSDCGVLVNTSSIEGMPNTFLEAAARGLALASLSVDPDALLTREGAGFCAGGDPDALAAECARLLDDAAYRRERGAAARRVLVARHDLNILGPRFASILREVAAAHAS